MLHVFFLQLYQAPLIKILGLDNQNTYLPELSLYQRDADVKYNNMTTLYPVLQEVVVARDRLGHALK